MEKLATQEISIKGLPGSEGIAIGDVLVIDNKKRKVQPKKINSESILSHLKSFAKSKQLFLKELDTLSTNLDTKTAGILETQKHIVSDVEIEKRINASIEVEQYSVDYSIYKVFNEFIERLRESGSELFQQRIVDIENIRDRLIGLSCENRNALIVEKGTILIVKDISPTDLIHYFEQGIGGLVMDKGGITSHAAIIAQSLGIPCLVSTKDAVSSSGLSKKAILDANNGELILNPSSQTTSDYKTAQKKEKRLRNAVAVTSKPSTTKDGKDFTIRANIEFVQELKLAKKFNATGIGLLRTEALLFGGIANKSESEQDKFYEEVLSKSEGEVTIRLFDVGGDKLISHTHEEANPFLGWRGIRMLLDEGEMFKSQLRSILKTAGKYPGRIKILVPMISFVEEIEEVRTELNILQDELKNQGFTVDEGVQLGVMIEVPSAALMADHIAKKVDFLSIGTNDLTQYTLAVDRGNERICSMYQHYHPAVWKLIQTSYDAAVNNGIQISVCGELAGDEIGAACLLGLGINDLSMSPSSIPKIKGLLIQRSQEELHKFSKAVLNCSTSEEVRELYRAWD
ncbi:MAG: phosphoenolpyruvate--protein phosphotransferase [Balneola sp.]|nr:MAG: phosphoenolpyruvate--protein phosphotransferase [Balneola sp.]